MHYLEKAGSLIAKCAGEAWVCAGIGACASYAVPAITTALGATAIAVSPLQAAIFSGFYAGIIPIMNSLGYTCISCLDAFIRVDKDKMKPILDAVQAASMIATYAVVLFATAYFAPTLAIPFTAALALNGGASIALGTFILLGLFAMRLANSSMDRTSQT